MFSPSPASKIIAFALLAAVAFPRGLFAGAPAATPAPIASPSSDAAYRITGQTVIEKPGYYWVAKDFSVVKGNPILIQSENVTVDLNHHAITGNPGTPVIMTESMVGLDNIRVTGGTLIGGHHGVSFTVPGEGAKKRLQVDHVKILESTSSAIEASGSNANPVAPGRVEAVIEDNLIYNQAAACYFGITLTIATGSRVQRNIVSGCERGLHMNAVENSVVEDNQFTGNSYAGLALHQGLYNRIANNQLSSNGVFAIYLTGSGNVIENNVLMNTKGTGLSIQNDPSLPSTGNIYAGNRAGGGPGYDIAPGNIDAGGNLPLPVELPPIGEPAPKTNRRPRSPARP